MGKKFNISQLSPHLFWDVDRDKLDIDKNRKLIVHRVLEYGLMHDWILLKNDLGIKKIGETAIKIKDLDDRALSFISMLTKIPEDQFICYSINQSQPKHWNFWKPDENAEFLVD